MSKIDMAIDFLGGGNPGCLWDIVAGAVCGDCEVREGCEGCDGLDLITEIENQIAQSGLDFMKRQAREWVKYSIER